MITDFIQRRFDKDCDWQNGNCYYFAIILTSRFSDLCLYYLPIQGHFVAGSNGIYYDSTGVVSLSPDEKPEEWEKLQKEDPLLASRIIRDCIL